MYPTQRSPERAQALQEYHSQREAIDHETTDNLFIVSPRSCMLLPASSPTSSIVSAGEPPTPTARLGWGAELPSGGADNAAETVSYSSPECPPRSDNPFVASPTVHLP
jgi:hypothetical protein